MPPGEHLHAIILDMNDNPIRPGQPAPILRRTRSGHLYQPELRMCNKVEGPVVQPITLRSIPAVRLEPKRRASALVLEPSLDDKQ